MPCILNKHGYIVSSSRNLRGIRRAVGKQLVRAVDVSITEKGIGKLTIWFENENFFSAAFSSYSVLLRTVRNWRNLYGVNLMVQGGILAGKISYSNDYLRGVKTSKIHADLLIKTILRIRESSLDTYTVI